LIGDFYFIADLVVDIGGAGCQQAAEDKKSQEASGEKVHGFGIFKV
jgi:hypothetical protein